MNEKTERKGREKGRKKEKKKETCYILRGLSLIKSIF